MIQFRCTGCDKLLSAPDDAVGKQAKCPNCAAVVPIPENAASAPISTSPEPRMEPFAGLSQQAPRIERPSLSAPPASPSGNPFADLGGSKPFKPPSTAPSTNPYATSSTFTPESFSPTFGEPGELRPTLISFDRLWASTYGIFSQRIGPCLLFGLVFLAVSFGLNIVASVVQQAAQATKEPGVIIGAMIFVQIVSFVVQTFLQMAGASFMLKLARQGQAGFETVSTVGPFLLQGLLVTFASALMQAVVMLVCVGPGALIGLAVQPPEGAIFGAVLGAIVGIIPAIYLGLSLYLSLYFVVDRKLGVVEALQTSFTYMNGNRLSLLGAGIVLGFLGVLVLLFTCFLGILVVIPFGQLFGAVVYLHATGQKTFDEMSRTY